MTGPIFFNVEEARTQLLTQGIVYTCRKKRTVGLTTARQGGYYKYKSLGAVLVEFEKEIHKQEDLAPYLSQSGFWNLEAWVSCIKGGLPCYLYKVTVLPNV